VVCRPRSLFLRQSPQCRKPDVSGLAPFLLYRGGWASINQHLFLSLEAGRRLKPSSQVTPHNRAATPPKHFLSSRSVFFNCLQKALPLARYDGPSPKLAFSIHRLTSAIGPPNPNPPQTPKTTRKHPPPKTRLRIVVC